MLVLRYTALLLALLAMAWPAAPPKAPPGLAGSAWRVVEVGGARTSRAGTLRFTQTSIRGKASCNAFFGSFRESHGRIEIAGLFPAEQSTADAAAAGATAVRLKTRTIPCDGQWSLERLLLESLSRAASYRFDRGMLVLIDAEGRTLARMIG